MLGGFALATIILLAILCVILYKVGCFEESQLISLFYLIPFSEEEEIQLEVPKSGEARQIVSAVNL